MAYIYIGYLLFLAGSTPLGPQQKHLRMSFSSCCSESLPTIASWSGLTSKFGWFFALEWVDVVVDAFVDVHVRLPSTFGESGVITAHKVGQWLDQVQIFSNCGDIRWLFLWYNPSLVHCGWWNLVFRWLGLFWTELQRCRHGLFSTDGLWVYLPVLQDLPSIIATLFIMVKVAFIPSLTLRQDKETTALFVMVVWQTGDMGSRTVFVATSPSDMCPTGFLAFGCIPWFGWGRFKVLGISVLSRSGLVPTRVGRCLIYGGPS